MIIKLRQLSEGTHVFEGTDDIESVGLDREIFFGNVSTKVIIDKRGQNYYIKILSNVAGNFICDRCLDEFSKVIICESKIVYTEDKSLIDSAEDEDDIKYLRPVDTEVDLSENIRQFILLSVPMKVLCSDECKGLCPRCWKNLNFDKCECRDKLQDNRWEKLKNLKFDG
ncbi:DUF177 domain-containing protein [candidate division KSB1 bacterium]